MLVVLEGLVLDIEPFISYHPGGQFVLQQRLGFNIDLPFKSYPYSGIKSEDGHNDGHMHSNDARKIAATLVIGKYSGELGKLPNFPGVDGETISITYHDDGQSDAESYTDIDFDF